jgi:hypothetical protein
VSLNVRLCFSFFSTIPSITHSLTHAHNAINADVEIDGLCANIVAFAARRTKVSQWRASGVARTLLFHRVSTAVQKMWSWRERAIFPLASIYLWRVCVCVCVLFLSAGVSIPVIKSQLLPRKRTKGIGFERAGKTDLLILETAWNGINYY